jgi:hypothetical protein
MHYVRMYLGGDDGAPGLTLYEIDGDGWVHRQAQIHPSGTRFFPEDILMCSPVNWQHMLQHPAAEPLGRTEFNSLWAEVDPNRGFRRALPDPGLEWQGWQEHRGGARELWWRPDSNAVDDLAVPWRRVPGFSDLWVRGDADEGWAAARDLFLERPIHWQSVVRHAA